jgi:hypothetical protein
MSTSIAVHGVTGIRLEKIEHFDAQERVHPEFNNRRIMIKGRDGDIDITMYAGSDPSALWVRGYDSMAEELEKAKLALINMTAQYDTLRTKLLCTVDHDGVVDADEVGKIIDEAFEMA